MASYNKVIMMGHLTRDPQMSYLPSQTAVCEFGIATNHRYKTSDGQQKEEVCFIDCNLFGKSAETFSQYMAKGRAVLVEGRLKLETWESKDGTRHSKHKLAVERFTFLGQQSDGQQPPEPRQQPQQQAAQGAPVPDEDPDSIPF